MAALGGRLAVVTGASRGIGAAVAALLRAEGATVVRVARSLAPGSEGGFVDLAADLADDGDLARAVETILERGVPDLVVSNAGAFTLGPFERQTVADLDRLYRVNQRARFQLARAFLPPMRTRGSGRHVLIGSISDHRPLAGNAAYSATQYAARGLHEVLREEYRGTGVLLSLVSPGAVDTALWDPFDPDSRADLPPRSAMLRPEDVAEAVRWIATRPPRVDVAFLSLGAA